MEMKGKVIVVTGGASGIGAALLRRFAREGPAGLVAADMNHEAAQAVAREVDGIAVRTDVSREADVRALFDALGRDGEKWSDEEEKAFKSSIVSQYERQSSPYYATARLWDDGIIDPRETRRTLSLGLAASLNSPIEDTRFGVFRM